MDVLSSNKVLQLEPLAPLIRQGERLADSPVFVLPKMRDGIDQTALAWEIRATSDHDTIVIQSLTADLTGTDIRLPWVVEGEFTAVAGALYITLCGKSATSDIVVKYVGSTALRVLAAEEGAYTPPANLFEDAVKAGSIAAAAASSAAQSAAAAESSKASAAASANAAGTSAASAAESKQSAANSATKAAETLASAVKSVNGKTPNQDGAVTLTAKDIGAAFPNLNLLDNSNFEDPVNQRGKTIYSAAGYSIDRWAIQDGTLEVAANQVILTQGTTFYEILDSAKLDLAAHYTLSIEFENGNKYSITGTFTNVQKTIPYGQLGLLKSTLPYVSFTASVRCGIKNMKLELGDVSTPYVAKTIGEEYAECLRYFCVGQNQILFGNALTAICPGRDFPVPMRVSPTVKIFGNGTAEGYLGTWGNANYSTIVAIAAKPNCIAYIQAAKNAAGDGMWTYAFHASADF